MRALNEEVRTTRGSSPVQLDDDPRGDAALHRRHVFQEKLNLGLLRMLATQHDHVHKAVREGVPASTVTRSSHPAWLEVTYHMSDKLAN
jgi:hypothetical protein